MNVPVSLAKMTSQPPPLPLGRIVHPTDFSPESETAFAHALMLALAAKGDLQILHAEGAAGKPHADWESYPRVRTTLETWGLLPANAAASALADQLGINVVKTDIGAQDPAQGVISYLAHHPADLIVLSTHAREGIAALTQPSVATPIAREARLPALFLSPGAQGFINAETGRPGLRNALICVDRHPMPNLAINMAAAFARSFGDESTVLNLLHVGRDYVELDIPGGVRVEWMIEEGPVVDTIARVADELDAELIVMTTQGHDGFLDALRGSTTEQVIRKSHRAVLAVPA